MFHLKKNTQIKATYEATAELRNRVLEILSDSTAGLTFYPEEHRYFLGNREMRSVSSIVEYFAPFDKVAVATRCSVNPKHEHYGKTVEEIIAIWEENGRIASEEGTRIHAFGEACYLYMLDRENEIEEEFRSRITLEGFLAVHPKEVALAQWWAQKDWSRYTPIAKETRIVNPALGYAGTFDLLLYDTVSMTFEDKDYKTNKDLDKWYHEMCLPPLSMLKRNDIGKYTIQQTSYTIQLRNISLPVSKNTLIWLRDDGFQERELPMNYGNVVEYAIRNYIQN